MDPAAERGRRTSPSQHGVNLRSTINRLEQSTYCQGAAVQVGRAIPVTPDFISLWKITCFGSLPVKA